MVIFKNNIILILLTVSFIGLNSCSEKKNNLRLKQTKSNYNHSYEDKYCYKRLLINYNYPNDITEEIEVYISKNNDTIDNQIKYYKKGVLDSTNSLFYKIELEESNKPGTYKGTFHYYSYLDSDPKNIDAKKTLRLAIDQKNRDSMYTQSFQINGSGNKIEFELINYKNNQLVATVNEFRVLEIDNSDRVSIIITELAVDNKLKTCNVGLALLKLKKEPYFTNK